MCRSAATEHAMSYSLNQMELEILVHLIKINVNYKNGKKVVHMDV